MTIRRFLPTFIFIIFSVGCGENSSDKKKVEILPFPQVRPPAMVQGMQKGVDYMVEHWWDGITDASRSYHCDSSLVSGVRKGDVEQNFANWSNALNMVDFQVAQSAIRRLYQRSVACEKRDTSSNVYETFVALVDKYLYDPNSPLRNEDFYAVFASCLSTSDMVEPLMQEKYSREVGLAALNQMGTKAADFRFSDKRGRIHTLYGIESDLTLLFFSNPGCTACKDIIDVLTNEPLISSLVDEGRMAVLNIYIDEDIQAWRSYMPIYPDVWYNGFDPDMVIRGETLYNVRAIPSLYLLDDQKNVIMKDAPEARVFDYLSRYAQQQ